MMPGRPPSGTDVVMLANKGSTNVAGEYSTVRAGDREEVKTGGKRGIGRAREIII